MIAQQPHEPDSSQTAPGAAQQTAAALAGDAGRDWRLSLVADAQAPGPSGHRLSELLPGRAYRLSSLEERDETVRQVRAHFGLQDFWEPV